MVGDAREKAGCFVETTRLQVMDHYYYKWNRLLLGNTLAHSHLQYEVYYFHAGRCVYRLGDRAITLRPGDLIIMNGLASHYPQVDRTKEYVRTMFSFDPRKLAPAEHGFLAINPLKPFELLRNRHLRLGEKAQAECEILLANINRFYHSIDTVDQYRLLAAFYDLLLFIYELCRPEMERKSYSLMAGEHSVRQAIVYIEEKYMEDIEMERMASELHMNRFHLMKVFREITGLTVFDYLYHRRVEQAKIMFVHSDRDTVTDVCYKVGFKHPSHFSRVFKQMVGETPDRYRRLVRGAL
ncbi:AraC family transcriptional regulator [Paenibacillus ginsengarvi]|uniref:AraC family transcriptional regulator n=1 Tax=Paenibacillus ginsengarvi TaxID=400777 RepID=A0A3B0C7L5_9BACL|nr:AraC family transcriptional regulator [Paenibacillus ginsengarvi]